MKILANLCENWVGNFFWEIFEAIQFLGFFCEYLLPDQENKFLISGQILIKIKSKWLYNPRKWRCMNYKKIQKFKRPPSNEHHPLITHTYFARNWVWILNLWKLELKSVPRQMYVFDEVTNKFENLNFSLTNSKGEVE